ncbi:MAG: type VI secretion system ATPase TssH [Polyangiales bacterium]
MSEISRVSLFGKLNSIAYKSIESATVFCKMRGNPYVELVHWIHQIAQLPDSDFQRILREYQLEPGRLAKDLTDALDRLPRGSTSISDLSSHIEDSVERAWVYATLMFGESQVRTGHLVVGLLKTPSLRNVLLTLSKEFGKIKLEDLTERFATLVSDSAEAKLVANDGFQLAGGATPGEASGALPPAQLGKQEALRRFSVDLTEKARKGEIDPILGRDEEMRQAIDILMRRRQNNPILTGEAGVGKTAVVEGLALRIARGDVPPPLRDVTLRTLDIGLLQAGASMKGEFENRLRQVIEEVQASATPIILFIDEAHTLIGAGGAQGTGDAANLLKPALARGALRTIAATTWAEYKKYIEKDPALTRRFQVVKVEEPTEDKALLMMRGVAGALEAHHRVQLLDEALEAAVKLSHRYIPERQLPDKSVSLLDTACARVAISQHAVPAEVEDSRRRIEALQTEIEIVAREQSVGIEIGSRDANAREKLRSETERLGQLEQRWTAEKALVDRILATREKLRSGGQPVDRVAPNLPNDPLLTAADGGGLPAAERAQLVEGLRQLQGELKTLQGDTPLMLPSVDSQAIASVVGDWTGIPVGRMLKNEIDTVLKLADVAGARVIGQRHALEMISKRIQTSRAGLENPDKPVGVFLLVGPSGVGKTETALTLAETLYGGEQNLITINMSEFQESHTVSTLKGAPPGYVGYGEGGVLTEAVRRRPYSVVLLDEVEKAHPDVHEIFFQVFDKGWMEDGEGRRIDFKNTLILLTSNVGSDEIVSMCRGDKRASLQPEDIAKALRGPLLEVFPAALLGRMVTIPYYSLSDEMIGNIVRLQLGRIQKRMFASHGVPLEYDSDVIALITSRCTEVESGARVIDALLTNTLLPRISHALLEHTLAGTSPTHVRVSVDKGDFAYAIA